MFEEETTEVLYPHGTIVQLRSGGPLLTTKSTSNGIVGVTYYNSISGIFEDFRIDQRCVRHAANKPIAPEGVEQQRTSVTKSSLS
jgi:uncharacterized protein YodC (DUF2158 family)